MKKTAGRGGQISERSLTALVVCGKELEFQGRRNHSQSEFCFILHPSDFILLRYDMGKWQSVGWSG